MKLGVNEGVGVCRARQQTPFSYLNQLTIRNLYLFNQNYINTVILHIETVTSHQQLIAHFIYIN